MEAKKEKFIITYELLKDWGACKDGLNDFNERYSNGKVAALDLLIYCENEGYAEYVDFLIEKLSLFFDNDKILKLSKKLINLNRLTLAERLVNNLPFNKTVLELNYIDAPIFYNGDVHIRGDILTRYPIIIHGQLTVGDKLSVTSTGYVLAKQVNAKEIYLGRRACIMDSKIEADVINLHHESYIRGEINANIVNMYNLSTIIENSSLKTDTLNLYGSACVKINLEVDTINMRNNALIKCFGYFGNINVKVNTLTVSEDAQIHGNIEAGLIKLKRGHIIGNVIANEVCNDGGFIDGNVNTIKIKNINGGEVDGKITYKRSDEHK